ncbi:MAG: pyocin knob domain-containing protein, partial [Fusobacteriaceae bacterium]
KLDEADGVVDGVIDDILAELDTKSNLDHIHKTSDVTTGVFPVSRGGTGSSFFENKYIVKSSGRDNLTSIAKIPLEDIDHDFSVEGLYAPFEHKHVWLDIDQTTVPLASEIERGIAYLVDNLLSPSDQSALSSRAAIEKFTEITDKIDSLNGDFAMREHTHNWIDINESTIPLASTNEYGIVKLSSSLSSREETIGATSRAVSDLYDLVQGASGDYASRVHQHDASDVISGILPISRGGTGCEAFQNGIVKSEYGSLLAVSHISVDEILNIRNEFSALEHKHQWIDIIDPPIASHLNFGLVKLTSDANLAPDPQWTAPSMLLYNLLFDKIVDLGDFTPIDSYSKFESDAKYIGYNRDLFDSEDINFIAQNGVFSKIDSSINIVNEPTTNAYVLRVYRYQNLTNQILYDSTGSTYVRSLYSDSWTDWARVWTSNDFEKATHEKLGLVTVTTNVEFGTPDSVPTAQAIIDFVGTGNTAYEPVISILEVDRGGTGVSYFEHDSGFVRIATSGDTEFMYTTDVVDWTELSNVPASSSSIAGIIKVSKTLEHSDDKSLVAASLELVETIRSEITEDVGTNYYTKIESDEKFLGLENELGVIDFDTIVVAGIYANNDSMSIPNQINAPTLERGILTVLTSPLSTTQIYTDITNKMFIRTFQIGAMSTIWVKIAMGKDVEIATYDDAGIFRVTDLTLDNNSETVPTTRIVNEALSNVINDSTKYVKKSGDIMTGDL